MSQRKYIVTLSISQTSVSGGDTELLAVTACDDNAQVAVDMAREAATSAIAVVASQPLEF